MDKCCDNPKIRRNSNIGFDIFDNGEEHQHLEKCENCKKRRFVSDFCEFGGKITTIKGKWENEKEVCVYWGD